MCHKQICYAHLCHTPSFTHNFVTNIFLTQLCHTQLCHTPSYTILHTHTTLSHTNSFTHNFVTHHLSHTSFTNIFHTTCLSHTTLSHNFFHTYFCHTHLFHTTLSQTIFHTQLCHTPSFAQHLSRKMATSTFVLRGRRGTALPHWAGSGGALGSRLAPWPPRSFCGRWHLVTSTFTLHGRRGIITFILGKTYVYQKPGHNFIFICHENHVTMTTWNKMHATWHVAIGAFSQNADTIVVG